MLVKLGLVEQRHKAVLEVMGGTPITDVARRYGVTRQTVHTWLRRYAASGIAGLLDHPCRPASCPHQMPPEVIAQVLGLRRTHPLWGPRTHPSSAGPSWGGTCCRGVPPSIAVSSATDSSTPRKGEGAGSDYRRWERSRSMELWQMDIMGGVKLDDGSELKIITGSDDHSRFCVSALCCAPGHGPAGLRSSGSGSSPLRRPRPDPHRQRQGVHEPLRSQPRRGALRPHLPGERHPASPHRSPLPDDHRQGGALPQDRPEGVP